MTTAQVVETSVTVNNNGAIQDYVHPDDQTQPTYILYVHNFLLICLRSRLNVIGTSLLENQQSLS